MKAVDFQRFSALFAGFESLPLRQTENPEASTVSGFFLLFSTVSGLFLSPLFVSLFQNLELPYTVCNAKCSRKCSRNSFHHSHNFPFHSFSSPFSSPFCFLVYIHSSFVYSKKKGERRKPLPLYSARNSAIEYSVIFSFLCPVHQCTQQMRIVCSCSYLDCNQPRFLNCKNLL